MTREDFERGLRELTGCFEEPPPWEVEVVGDSWRFRWKDIQAAWVAPQPEELIAWLAANEDRLQVAYVSHLEGQWAEPILERVRRLLRGSGFSEDVLEDLAVTFWLEHPIPPHYAQAEAAQAALPPRPLVSLTHLGDPDVEEVAVMWSGPDEIAEVASQLAERFLAAWEELHGPA